MLARLIAGLRLYDPQMYTPNNAADVKVFFVTVSQFTCQKTVENHANPFFACAH